MLHSALDKLGEGLVLLTPTWELTFVNSRAATFLGHDVQSCVGENFWTALPHLQIEQGEFYAGCQRSLKEQLPLGFECESLYEHESLWVQLEPHAEGLTIYLRGGSSDHRWVNQQQQYDAREALLTATAQRIQQKEDLHVTFQTTVEGLLPLFRVDRALLYRIENWQNINLIAQATSSDWALQPGDESRTTWVMNSHQDWVEGSYYPVADVDQDDVTLAEQRLLRALKVKSQIIVPIFQEERFWGLLVLHQCHNLLILFYDS